jgi:hypothetical protein
VYLIIDAHSSEEFDRVGRNLNSGANFTEGRSRLEDEDMMSPLNQINCKCKTTKSSADNQDVEFDGSRSRGLCNCHLSDCKSF